MPAGHKDTYAILDDLVREAIDNVGETIHKYEKFFRWGISYAKRWHMDQAREVVTKEIELTDYKAIKLPKDCVDWTKIGVRCGNMIKTFINDDNIALKFDDDGCGDEYNEDCPDINGADVTDDSLLFINYGEGRMFGQQVKDNGLGYFTVNTAREETEIQFRTDLPSTTIIYLEYITDGFCPNKDTLLHPYAADLVRDGIEYEYLRYKWRTGSKNYNYTQVQEAQNYYDKEFNRVQDRMFELTVEDILEYSRSGYKLTPKR
jgi:hypothetical protein